MSEIFPQFRGKLIDTHCHLNDPSFDADRGEVVARAKELGVDVIIDMGIDLESSRMAVNIAYDFEGVVFAAVGIDPERFIPGSSIFIPDMLKISDAEFSKWLDYISESLRELHDCNPGKVVMIGECGMDGRYLNEKLKSGEIDQATYDISLKRQEEMFVMHIRLANELGLPLSVHSRGLEQETLNVLVANKGRGIMHSFTGSHETLKQILDSGNAVGLNAIYTYNSGKELLETLKAEIAERDIDISSIESLNNAGIFFETDAPYLALRSSNSPRNEPSTVAKLRTFLRENI